MSLFFSISLTFVLTAVVLLLAAREVSAYRLDQASRAEIYPYTKKRLVWRLTASGCLIGEVVLLGVVRFALSPTRPGWFLVYVSAVLFLAAVMVVMAFFDFRESVRLGSWTLERLRKEFIHEVRRGKEPPETH
ncbi:MAG: hypothetical protein V1495_03475 [Pseudomonadota bacterium]